MTPPVPQSDPREDADMTARRRMFWAAVVVSSSVIFGIWLWLLPASLKVQGGALSIQVLDDSIRGSSFVQEVDGLKDGLSGVAQQARAVITPSDAAKQDSVAGPVAKLKARIEEENRKNSIEAQQP